MEEGLLNRCVLVPVSADLLLDLFRWNDFQQMRLPVLSGIPEDAVVAAVNWDHSFNAFVLKVCSSSFDKVPIGVRIPIHNAEFKFIDVPIREVVSDQENAS